ncbi:MAG: Nif3-like dinuclear metal center hexameric protein [Treponema sp.]
MNTKELDLYFKQLLNIDEFSSLDISKNGLQVDNDGSAAITKIAFAVDASLETIKRAKALKASCLFVHHGFFWKNIEMIKGAHYNRIKALFDGNIALYACHLPLDAHHIYGNNAGLADRIDLEQRNAFAFYHGKSLGVVGNLKEEKTIEELCLKLLPNGEKPSHILPFGKEKNKSVAILSGSGASEIDEAIELSVDLYVTGEIKHETYHKALEAGINVIAAGHYNTETVGLSLLMRKTMLDLSIETCFIDVPTGL